MRHYGARGASLRSRCAKENGNMINLICAPKGGGKTKEMIKRANDALDICKGHIVYITDNDYSHEINTAIRFIDVSRYGKINEDVLIGFIKGVIASDSDVKRIYVDGLVRMLGVKIGDTEEFFIALEDVSETFKVDITVSATADKTPKFLKKYL